MEDLEGFTGKSLKFSIKPKVLFLATFKGSYKMAQTSVIAQTLALSLGMNSRIGMNQPHVNQ